jgi:methylmalonyl-CoA mutase
MDDLSLAAEFPAATREQWLKLVEGVLKGADFEKRLVSHSYDGIALEPLYPKAESTAPVSRGTGGRWRIAQRMDHPEPQAANQLALADLEGGADSLNLVLRNAPAARGFGLAVETIEDLDRALAGVVLDIVHLRLDAGGHGRQAAAMLVALAERRGHKLADLQLDLALDPIGAMATLGKLSASWDIVAARCADTLHGLAERSFNARAFLADGRPYHEAGGSEAQELAAVLGTAVAYLRALEAGGHSLEAARDSLSFLLVADADEFLTIAKFRALRRLWAQVETACGVSLKPLRLHAETAWRMTTRRDPWVNLLRTTMATFSAGLGGADCITVLPFTTALGLPDAFARRLARNTQHILLEESNLWRVLDPAAGSGAFEALTDALCERAWAAFQEIEAEGGIVESLRGGAVQARVAETRAARERAVATRKDPLTGTSDFPNLREETVSVLMRAGAQTRPEPAAARPKPPAEPGATRFGPLVEAAAAGTTLSELANSAPGAGPVHIEPLRSLRLAEPFERLRDRSDAHLARTGTRPQVLLINLGPPSAFTAPSTFAKNFFEAGGVEAVELQGDATTNLPTGATIEAKAKLACLCSSDEIYAREAISVAEALTKAGDYRIYIAGRPVQIQQELARAGVKTFIFAGCDTLRILTEALEAAGA